MCAPFTAIEVLNTLVRAFGTYISHLLFDRDFLVEMFESGVNNAKV